MAGGVGVHSAGQRQLVPCGRRASLHAMVPRRGEGVPACRAAGPQQFPFAQPDEEWRIFRIAVAVVDFVMVVDNQGFHAQHHCALWFHSNSSISTPSPPSPFRGEGQGGGYTASCIYTVIYVPLPALLWFR